MMRRSRTCSLRAAAGLFLALVVALPAACGGATHPVPAPTPNALFNQKLHDLLPKAVRDRGVLRVGTEASYAPMSAFGPDGRTIVGMEPDLGEEIGRVLGVRLQFRNYQFSTLLTDVARGNLDLAMSAVTDTPQRARIADFVNYFRSGTSIVVQRGNPAGITGLNSLCGKVVAVQRGTTQVDLLARAQKSCGGRAITVNQYPTNSDALVHLRTGRAAAVLNDLPPAVLLVTDKRTSADYQLASDQQYDPGPYGIVVAKNQPRLRDAIQGALEELQRNGVYGDILARWHVQDGAVPNFTVNSGR